MSPTLYIDDYTILDLHYVVHLCKMEHCPDDSDEDAWLIVGILHIAHQAAPCAIVYPTRGHRDAAFEAMTALLRQVQAQEACDDENE